MRADVVHAHNLHPLLGWRALAAARAAGARTVLHLHNFRLFCAIAIGYRDGAPCFRCRGATRSPGCGCAAAARSPRPPCTRRAFTASSPASTRTSTGSSRVSDATAARLHVAGAAGRQRRSRCRTSCSTDALAGGSTADRGAYALVSGRLVEEKGFDTAIGAARGAGVPLVIAGDGPDEPRLRDLAVWGGRAVHRPARRPRRSPSLRSRAAVVLAPSRWEEPCPYSVLDALAAGVPVLAGDRGGLPELVGHAATLAPDDPTAWARALGELWREPARRASWARPGSRGCMSYSASSATTSD